MKKIVICNIPMRENVAKTVYASTDNSLPVSEKPYRYPINSFLAETVGNGDDLKIILLIKKDGNAFYEKNTADYKQEIEEVCLNRGARAEFVPIDTAFSQNKENHEQLMGRLIDEIDTEAHVLVDITYGPKDLPIVIFSALNFAEKFLKFCSDWLSGELRLTSFSWTTDMASENYCSTIVEKIFNCWKSCIYAFGVGDIEIFVHRNVEIYADKYLFTVHVDVFDVQFIHEEILLIIKNDEYRMQNFKFVFQILNYAFLILN